MEISPEDNPVLAAAEQLDTQLLFQLHQLTGQGRLGHMEQRRRPGDIFFPGHGQKVPQRPKFHASTPCLSSIAQARGGRKRDHAPNVFLAIENKHSLFLQRCGIIKLS